MAQAACTEAEFIKLFDRLNSAQAVASELGINVRNVQTRRRAIESRLGRVLGQAQIEHEPAQIRQEHSCHIGKSYRIPIKAAERTKPVSHCFIPDTQVKRGVPLEHLGWAGNYVAEKRPDVLILAGDFADMKALSSYDRGKRSAENQRLQYDIEAAHQAMELLMTPIVKAQGYSPRLVITLGNHEDRITRYADDHPELEGTVSVDSLGYASWGWEVIPYRQPIVIDGVSYCHYFYNPNTGKPYAGANLETRLKTIGHSFTMGHQQGLSSAIRDLSNGSRQRGLVAGSFYQHQEEYKGPQGNGHWHGIIMKHEVKDGNYDLMEVSLDYLRRKYS